MDEQLLDLQAIQKWTDANGTEKMGIIRSIFSNEFTELTPRDLALLSTYMALEGYKIPNTTTAMLAVLHCLEESGAVETSEGNSQTLLVRINNGSR